MLASSAWAVQMFEVAFATDVLQARAQGELQRRLPAESFDTPRAGPADPA
jgi:hypothetical protein